ncbi:MAG: hypothetical protein IKY36_04700 [Bacteroidales bacterium]|nr:hypothetical protein [Bacteroidales bacterium]
MRANSIKLSFVYILSLLAIVSCLQEERSPEDILVPSPAQVETSDASLMLASKVPTGSERLVQECGFYYSKDKSMADTRKVAGMLAANNFTAELPDRTYGTTYYICAYVTNGHGSEIRSDLRTFQLDELEEYVEFGQVNMVSFDPSSKQLMITIDTDIWAGVSVSEAGVCYGAEPTSLSIEGDHKEGVYRSETRAEAGVIEILLNNFSEATQYYLRPYVKDGDYLSYGEVVPFYIPAVAKVSTFEAEGVTASGATLSGEVTDECGSAVTERGFAWIEGDAVPTIEDSHMAVGSGLGAMTATVEGLDPNKKYTFRAYATNASGTAYGEAKVFTTLVALPSLAASTISNITSTSATFNGVLANDGGESVSEVGFYYSTEKEVNPETAQKVSLEYSTYQKSAKELSANTLYSAIQSAQAAASDEGEFFSIDVYSLGIKTKYYVKSYAVNSAGVAYGSVVNFETSGEIATIKTVGSSEVTTSSAVLSANITTDNGEKITERGFVWMEGAGNPTTESNKLKVSGEVGEYTATLEGLDPNKKYSFRAYAINAEGTAYGDVMSFTTKVDLPALSNVVIPSLSSTTATLTSKVTYHGGETITEVGFYYSTESDVDPETSQKVSRIYSEDTFSIEVANLGINTKYYVKAYAINSAGTAYSEINSFKTESSVPSVQTIGVADITPESALLSGSILSDNGASITERGFVWIQGDGTPTVDSHKLTATGTTGEFTSSLTGLEPNKKYSFRAYATNSKGTAYGEIMTFSTVAGLPALSSVDVSAITSTSATFSSTVTDHGGETVSEVGFYYSTDETVDPATSVKVTQKYAKDVFTSQIADLAIFTKYYVKAYATNSAGTAYSVIYSFTTLASTPIVNTIGSSEVTSTTAVLSGTVVADNGAEVTERGFVWMLGEGVPTIDSYKITTSGKIGDYTATVKDLAPNQKYSFRAYAVNSVGTSYGEIMSFTTSISKASLASVTISNIEETSATISSKVTGHGGDTVSEVGFYYSTEEAVDPEKSVKVNRVYSSDSFSISISGLAINTKYYVKAYAVNSAGTVYSDVASFTTLASTPVVNTVGSSEISSTGAVLSGTVVTDNGAAITERGFVWLKGTDAPTTSSNKVKVEGATGDFTATISGLDPNRKYSFRAYAINSKGTAYGDIMIFNTVAGLPALSAMKVSSITTTSATFTCTVTNHGGETVSEVGFYYSKEESVDVETAQKISEVYSSDTFTLKAEDLEIGQNYYVKAYVKNSVGEAYSAVIAFKTTSTAPSVSTIGYTKLSATSAELSGQVMDDNGENITERGFVWVKGTSTPTTSSSKQSVEGTVGDYTATITDLEPNQIYSFRAYAINSKGTAYGDVMQLQIAVTLPTVTTNEVIGITNTTATSGGVIISDGGGEILAKGVVWSMRQNPTLESSNMTNEGEGTDAFTSQLSGLTPGIPYYVRAYATNVMGTTYGEEKQFTTTGEIQGTPLEASNSFIISNAGTYTFQTVKGNSSESVGSVASAEVLWESFGTDEQPEVGSLVPFAVYKNGKITFGTPDQHREGNAVIAAKDASGTILWSWHIWLTDEPQEQVYYNNAGTMMDRNLGATSATPGDVGALGLLYQWGRKDPLLGSSSIRENIEAKSTITWPSVVSSNSSNGTISYATEHPTTFITGNGSNYDWYYPGSSSTDNTRWQSSKTIYDPCPAGWRVPDGGSDGVWSKALGSSYSVAYDSTNEGMNFSGNFGDASTIWYPASGNRSIGDGALYSVGGTGTYWSVTPNDYYAYRLYFSYNGSVFPSDYSYRAYGCGVRCQKEGTGGGPMYDNNFSTSGARSLSSAGTANSYIVSGAGVYSISPVKGNSLESVGSVASAEVLWETFGTDEKIYKGSLVSGAKYENGKIYFKTADSYREGNAVVAAKDASGTILWSWHIWLTDEPEGQVYYNNAGTMMDRNLGATSATPGDVGALGLLYQWGRKDPFLGSSSISEEIDAKSTLTWPSAVSSNSTNGTIDYAVEHPTTFITGNGSNYDWYYTGSSSTDNTRWQSSKTIYDPCPAGWRVPDGGSDGVWSTALGSSSYFKDDTLYDSSNAGINFSGNFGDASTIWYPASGHRYYVGGALLGVGSYGNYWSVTPSNYDAYSLHFDYYGSVYPSSSSYRASGLGVRCVQE